VDVSTKARKPSSVVWDPSRPIERVDSKNPLVGLETRVLQVWLENSPSLRRQYARSPAHRLDVENAVRVSVATAFGQELELRARGLSQEQAEEFTRPAMWTPPTWR
jgi:hypothetical protein